MRRHFNYRRCIFLLSLLTSMSVGSKPLLFMLSVGEGGSLSSKAKHSFEAHLADGGCDVKVSFVNDAIEGEALYFSAKPPSIDDGKYERLVKVRTYKGSPLTSAVLIKASTGISDLKSLEGERLSVVSKTSYLGWSSVRDLYVNAGVQLDKNNIYEAGTYEGVIALLLHGDVFTAALPGSLARRWANANNLIIIAESTDLGVGDIWVRKQLPNDQKQACKKALVSLVRTNRRDKRMSIFPAWVEGFK